MAEKVALKIMKCPTCGANLKAVNNSDAITCVYCGNTIVPVAEATPVAQTQSATGGFGGVLKVEGIKTSSSALAYIEQFFEEYDWYSFTYAQALSIAEIDKLANSLKASSADDKNTWFACFKAKSVPFIHKVTSCQKMLTSIIDEYKKDNLDAYSQFDAYKRIATMIFNQKNTVIYELAKIATKAEKYGAFSTELSGLAAELDSIRNLPAIVLYNNIEDIPEIQTFIQEKNAKIAAELAAQGIDADAEYTKAKSLIAQRKYVEALNILLSLKGYADTDALIEKIDKYYLIFDILEIDGKLYYFKTEAQDGNQVTLSLYPTIGGKIAPKPIIRNIGKIITNYADILYYMDSRNHLWQYNLSTNIGVQLLKTPLNRNHIYVYNHKVFLLAKENESSPVNDIISLDLATGRTFVIMKNVSNIVRFAGNKLVYTFWHTDEQHNRKLYTNILNVDTMKVTVISEQPLQIEGFVNNAVVYTRESPNKYNKSLYIKELNPNTSERLIEHNIYEFCNIISDKLFYYIGSSKNKTLINIECDGSGRKEWPQHISKVLFEQGGWLYFIRRAGYNAILCKSRLDGSQFKIIAADIDEFIDLKNGYLYYINDDATLVKVRMDGSNLQELCQNVEKVLCVQEDKIVFVSIDDTIAVRAFEQTSLRTVKSIYAVDFTGSGKIKLAYNIKSAEEYDENTVYYITSQDTFGYPSQTLDTLHKLNANTYHTEKLLDVEIIEDNSKTGCGFILAILGLILGCIMLFAAMGSGEPDMLVPGLLLTFISGIIAVAIKSSKKNNGG